jgi:hypothetical protein
MPLDDNLTKSTVQTTIDDPENLLEWSNIKLDLMSSAGIYISKNQAMIPLKTNTTNNIAMGPEGLVDPLFIIEHLNKFQAQIESTSHETQTEMIAIDNPFRALTGTLTAESTQLLIPDSAVMNIDYSEGYPVIETTQFPIWDRLSSEPTPYYKCFSVYLALKYNQGFGTRSLQQTHKLTKIPITTLSRLSKIFHWKIRSTAYDMYRDFLREQQRNYEIVRMQGVHQKTAKELFQMCAEYIQSNVNELTPATALKWFEAAVKLERLSLGLNPDEPVEGGKNNSSNNNTTIQIGFAGIGIGEGQSNKEVRNAALARNSEILEVLMQSGAFKAVQGSLGGQESSEEDIIDAQITEIESEVFGASEIVSPSGTRSEK